jgi:mannose-1-phosphate guanylyltransferase / mannose-6-phosphate isomerase
LKNNLNPLIVPVILSGGSGSRLWPLSREGHPKPFIELADGETLLEKTYRRASILENISRENGKPLVITITNTESITLSVKMSLKKLKLIVFFY